jgi:spermidine synthase
MSGLRRIRSMLEFQEVDKDQGVERNYLYYKDSSHHYHTEKQEVDLIESATWGTMLFLNGVLQSTTRDELIYHSALVHPIMALEPLAENILILGGGEGATAREVLRYNRVKQVTMIDWDGELIEIMKKHGAAWSHGAWEDSRLRVVCEDAWAQLPHEDTHDLAIIDLTDPDPKEDNWLELLTKVLINVTHNVRGEGGPIVLNAGLYTPWATKNLVTLRNTLELALRLFPKYIYKFYTAWIPSFNGPWTFILLSQTDKPLDLSVVTPWVRYMIRELPLELLTDANTMPDCGKI